MLTVRTGVALDTHAREIADVLARAITDHPLADRLHGTVLIGIGGTGLITAADVRPRVMVPLLGAHTPGALMAAQVAVCDCVVVRDATEARRLAHAATHALVVVADDPHGTGHAPFLRGPDARQTIAAWDAVDENPELRDALAAVGRQRDDDAAGQHALIADAVAEALVAFQAETRG